MYGVQRHGEAIGGYFPPAPPAAMDGTLLNNLIHYWYLGEASGTRSDSIGTLHFSTVTGSPTQMAGKYGNAVNCGSSSDWLATGNYTTPAAFSISFWFNGTMNENTKLISQTVDAGDTNGSFELYAAGSSQLGAVVGTNGGGFGSGVTASGTYGAGWNLAVLTFDTDTKPRISLNGSAFVVGSVVGAHSATASPIRINGRPPSGFQADIVKMDELAMWSRALTQDEVTSLYNGGAGKFYIP